MALRMIPPIPGSGGRTRKTNTRREVVSEVYGGTRTYGPCPHAAPPANLCTGGVSMVALLGPDMGDGMRRGTPTNQTSLQPLMGLLNGHSAKSWVAGHLLNADLGGSGTSDRNLTPLTVAANNAHATFEQHVKNMLIECNRIDRGNPGHPHWYGVRYRVVVSATPYANAPAVADMHSYAYSHITITYEFVTLPKFPPGGAAHTAPAPPNAHNAVALGDAFLAQLQGVTQPVVAPSVNIVGWAPAANAISFGPIQIHNEP